MRRMLLAAVFGVVALTSTGCVTRMQNAQNVVDLNSLDLSKLSSYKRGESCINNILFLFSWGDNLITSAANDGKLKKIRFIENEVRSFVIFNKFCLVAYGE